MTDIARVMAASGALFSGNTASRAFWMTDPEDIALHNSNIQTNSRSAPPNGNKAFTYLFNNYDVNYTKGDAQNPLPLFSITVMNDGNGAAGADKSVAYQGETVTLTATPYPGYRFKKWIVISGNITAINDDGTFVISDSDVMIQAVFEPMPAAGGGAENKITGSRINNYTIREIPPPSTSILIEEMPPPLAGLPREANPDTGRHPSSPYAILGISTVILGVFIKKKTQNK